MRALSMTITLGLLALLGLPADAQRQPRLHRVLSLGPPHLPEGTFLVVGDPQRPPAHTPVTVVRQDGRVGPSTETPTITPERHVELVLGPRQSGALSGTLLPCNPSRVLRERAAWIRDRLHDDRWRRATLARVEGDCDPLASPGPTFLSSTGPLAVTVGRPTADRAIERAAADALGATEAVVYRNLGVGVEVIRFAENSRWHYARRRSGGRPVRLDDAYVMETARVGYGGPVALCVAGTSFLLDRRTGPSDAIYRLLRIGDCPPEWAPAEIR